jgi:hypothetical protein
MKIKNLVIASLAAGAALLSSSAMAQNTDSKNASGSVTLIRPIAIAKNADLQFGRIVKPATGAAAIAIANTADTVSTDTAVALAGVSTSRAKFTITGESAQAIDITVGTLTMNGPNSATIVVTLTPDQVSGATLSGGTIGSAGSLSLNIGGNFSLPAAQETGVYTGTFPVTVSYQ